MEWFISIAKSNFMVHPLKKTSSFRPSAFRERKLLNYLETFISVLCPLDSVHEYGFLNFKTEYVMHVVIIKCSITTFFCKEIKTCIATSINERIIFSHISLE